MGIISGLLGCLAVQCRLQTGGSACRYDLYAGGSYLMVTLGRDALGFRADGFAVEWNPGSGLEFAGGAAQPLFRAHASVGFGCECLCVKPGGCILQGDR